MLEQLMIQQEGEKCLEIQSRKSTATTEEHKNGVTDVPHAESV